MASKYSQEEKELKLALKVCKLCHLTRKPPSLCPCVVIPLGEIMQSLYTQTRDETNVLLRSDVTTLNPLMLFRFLPQSHWLCWLHTIHGISTFRVTYFVLQNFRREIKHVQIILCLLLKRITLRRTMICVIEV